MGSVQKSQPKYWKMKFFQNLTQILKKTCFSCLLNILTKKKISFSYFRSLYQTPSLSCNHPFPCGIVWSNVSKIRGVQQSEWKYGKIIFFLSRKYIKTWKTCFLSSLVTFWKKKSIFRILVDFYAHHQFLSLNWNLTPHYCAVLEGGSYCAVHSSRGSLLKLKRSLSRRHSF